MNTNVISPPSRNAIMALLDAVKLCNTGQREQAVRELEGAARVVEVLPTLMTDLYHFAHAAIQLGLEREVSHAGLLHVMDALKKDRIRLTGPDWVGTLYHDLHPGGSDAAEASSEVDLEFHFSEAQRMFMGSRHLKEGSMAYEERRLDDALTHFRSALRIAQSLGYAEGVAVSLFEIGFVLHSRNQTEFAEHHYRDAVAAAGGDAKIAPYLFRAGRLFETTGDRAKAREYFQRALALFEESSDSEGINASTEKLKDANPPTE